MIVAFIADNFGPVVSITDTAGLTWQERARNVGIAGQYFEEEWYAIATSSLSSDVITITQTGSGVIPVDAFGVSGANTSSPFDGTAATNASGDITGYSTSNADDMLIAGYREGTYPSRAAGDFGSAAANLIASANYALTQNLPVTAIQSGITVTQTPDDGTQNGGIVDAIKSQ